MIPETSTRPWAHLRYRNRNGGRCSACWGDDLPARLLRISTVSLRRYLSGAGRTPDDVAVRLHALALIVGDLAGAYDDAGIRRWLARPRTALGNRAAVDVVAGCGSLTIPKSGRCTSSRRVDGIVHHAIMLGFCRN